MISRQCNQKNQCTSSSSCMCMYECTCNVSSAEFSREVFLALEKLIQHLQQGGRHLLDIPREKGLIERAVRPYNLKMNLHQTADIIERLAIVKQKRRILPIWCNSRAPLVSLHHRICLPGREGWPQIQKSEHGNKMSAPTLYNMPSMHMRNTQVMPRSWCLIRMSHT
jgi:hypothetical protein